jgi:hypothetical protein
MIGRSTKDATSVTPISARVSIVAVAEGVKVFGVVPSSFGVELTTDAESVSGPVASAFTVVKNTTVTAEPAANDDGTGEDD